MSVKKNFSVAIVDIDRIDEVNKIVIQYATSVKEYSSHFYFDLRPMHGEDINMDITLFQIESENEADLNKTLNDLVEVLNQLNTGYAIRNEDTSEMIVEIEHVIALYILFDDVKFINKGTYEKIDEFNHLKTEFGICKNYHPNFRPLEGMSIENIVVEPETVYLFSNSAENLSKLKDFVFEKIMDIDSDFKIESDQFIFSDKKVEI